MVSMCIAHTDHAHAQVELIIHLHMLTMDMLTMDMLTMDMLIMLIIYMHRLS